MEKSYKEHKRVKNMVLNKRGQMTIFIIIAIVLVAIIAVIFLIWKPTILGIFERELNPNIYLEECIKPEIMPAVSILADQGGYQEPQGYTLNEGKKIQYLCYTDDYYETCTIQQPMTKTHFEKELNLMVKGKADKCVNTLIGEYKKRGYDVSSGGINSEISLVPGKILVTFNAPLTVTKETTSKYKSFDVELKSEMYDLLFIAHSILEYETTLGDSVTEMYIQYYPNLKISKTRMSDGTKIYKLSDVTTNEQFVFASRSLSWPAGYGLEEVRE